MADKIPSWPKVTIRLYDDHNAEVKIAGRSHPVNHHDPRQAAIAIVSERAAQLGRAVKATAVEADGASWPLIIHPDGQVESVEAETGRKSRGGGGGGGGGNGQKPIWPIVVAMVVGSVLILSTIFYLAVLKDHLGNKKPTSTASPTLPALPGPSVGPDQFTVRPAPPGFTAQADWTVNIARDSQPAVAPDGTEVAILTTDHKVAVFDTNGKVKWQDKVPNDAESPVYTTVDAKPVLAVVTSRTLYYWAGNGARATEIELPDGADVQFFGTSPLVVLSSGTEASVVSGGELKPLTDVKRLATILLAEGDRMLSARYTGPLYWSQPGKDQQIVGLKKPAGAKDINHIVSASPGRVLVAWNTATPETVIPSVQSTVDGSVVATCQNAGASDVDGWSWLPDPGNRVAAWGPCLINFSTHKSVHINDFHPLSLQGTSIYGTVSGDLYLVNPGRSQRVLADTTARPWGIAGTHAIVVHYDGHDDVLYALDKQ
ncbi:hypothetical protein AB0E69_31990 [Kribbella sp. NPDC026611]|uniref:hypothetical protein n=1 Tax=Kribbella sp. NPDC026611 TaxID=3154911 RepID=UPI0033C86940